MKGNRNVVKPKLNGIMSHTNTINVRKAVGMRKPMCKRWSSR